jgi:hypothetical protein
MTLRELRAFVKAFKDFPADTEVNIALRNGQEGYASIPSTKIQMEVFRRTGSLHLFVKPDYYMLSETHNLLLNDVYNY